MFVTRRTEATNVSGKGPSMAKGRKKNFLYILVSVCVPFRVPFSISLLLVARASSGYMRLSILSVMMTTTYTALRKDLTPITSLPNHDFVSADP